MESKEQIFTDLINRYLPAFRRMAVRILSNADDADDAVQDALVIAWEKYSVFRRQSTLYTWVTGILIHCCYKIRAKRITTASVPLDETYMEVPDEADNLENLRMLDQLENAIAGLPPLYRAAIVTGCLSGLPGKDAAVLLNCTPNTLYQRINTAKRKLKETLQMERKKI